VGRAGLVHHQQGLAKQKELNKMGMDRMHFEAFIFEHLELPGLDLDSGLADGSDLLEVQLRLHVQVMSRMELPKLKVVVSVPLSSLC
jgi:hypothetical protein